MAESIEEKTSTCRLENRILEKEYYSNSFTLIGLKDYLKGTRVTPKSGLYLGNRTRVSLAAGTPDRGFMKYSERVIKALKRGYLPIVHTNIVVDGALQYETEMFAGPLAHAPIDGMESEEDNFINYVRVRITNLSDAPSIAAFRFEFSEQLTASTAIQRPTELREENGHFVAMLSGRYVWAAPVQKQITVTADSNVYTFSSALAPGAVAEFHLRIPYYPVDKLDRLRPETDYETLRQEVELFWERFLSKGAQLEIPHEKALNTFKANIIYTFITRDRGEIHPGEGFYDLFWTRDAAFINYSIQMLNFTQEAEESLESFWLRNKDTSGAFVSHKGQLDGTGQGLWGLYEYYMLSRDKPWLSSVYPRLIEAVQWIMDKRRTDLPKDDPYYGIMPNSLADGECLWGGEYHIVGYDLWSLRGIDCMVELAKELGYEEDAAAFQAEFDAYKTCVLKALDRAGVDHFPPSYELKGTHWSNTKMVFPTPVMDPFDARVTETLNDAESTFIENVCAWNGEGKIIEIPMKAIHPYMSTYITQTRLVRGEHQKVVEQFYAMLDHTTSTHGFPEGIFYEYRLSWNDTLPHIYGSATYLILLRNMLIQEERDTLHLGRGIPSEWLAPGKRVKVERMLTKFGLMDMEIACVAGELQVRIDLPKRQRPRQTLFYLPPDMAGARIAINGEQQEKRDGRVILLPPHLLER